MPHGVEVIFAVIRRRNRKRSDGADAVVRSDAVAIRAPATWQSFDNPFRWYGLRSSWVFSDSEDKR
jgi:hypothetical protein